MADGIPNPNEKLRGLGRRHLLASTASTFLRIGLPAAAANRAMFAPTAASAQGDPLTSIMAVNAAMATVGLFTENSDGGLGAMLAAENAKLNLISEQLRNVASSLADLHIAVGALPATFKEIVDAGRTIGRIEAIRGAALGWQEIFSDKHDLDPGVERSHLNEISYVVRQNRLDIFANMDQGENINILAATIAPVLLALEANLSQIVFADDGKVDPRALVKTLNAHIRWHNVILNPARPQSAAATFTKLSNEVAKELAEFAKRPVVAQTQFSMEGQGSGRVGIAEVRTTICANCRSQEGGWTQKGGIAYELWKITLNDVGETTRRWVLRRVSTNKISIEIMQRLLARNDSEISSTEAELQFLLQFLPTITGTESVDGADIVDWDVKVGWLDHNWSQERKYLAAHDSPPLVKVRALLDEAQAHLDRINLLEARLEYVRKAVDIVTHTQSKALARLQRVEGN